MTKAYDVQQTEVGDMACLAVEQFGYLEALFSAITERLDKLDLEYSEVRGVKKLALLGRSHAQQWESAFLDDVKGEQ
jgi:hypothetical protein